MCKAKSLNMLNSLAMRLSRLGQHHAALVLLGLALRQSLQLGAAVHEAKIRNNLALVLELSGRNRLARRQLEQAMALVADRVGTDNKFFGMLQNNHARNCPAPAPAELAA